ncbi:MAG: hypothetical protein GY754_25020 [bacterium]|nr:hypothetical protein [bacterium]
MNKRAFCIIIFLFFVGCSSSDNIFFCEGVSPEGEGVNCGKKFEAGELTAIIKGEAPFGVKKIDVRITELKKGLAAAVAQEEKEAADESDGKKKKPPKAFEGEKISVDVDPEKSDASANLPLYTGGLYRVEAVNGDKKLAKGTIEIIEY